MNDYEYSVLVGDTVLAKGMTLGIAMMLVRAEFNEFPQDADMKVSIQRNAIAKCTQSEGGDKS